MATWGVQKRVYMRGDKQPVTVRLPAALKTALEELATENGWKFTDITLLALDQFVQREMKKKVDKKG